MHGIHSLPLEPTHACSYTYYTLHAYDHHTHMKFKAQHELPSYKPMGIDCVHMHAGPGCCCSSIHPPPPRPATPFASAMYRRADASSQATPTQTQPLDRLTPPPSLNCQAGHPSWITLPRQTPAPRWWIVPCHPDASSMERKSRWPYPSSATPQAAV